MLAWRRVKGVGWRCSVCMGLYYACISYCLLWYVCVVEGPGRKDQEGSSCYVGASKGYSSSSLL